MNALLLALRNLQRNRRRTAATLLAMILGMVAVLLFGGYVRDLVLGMQTNYVSRSGHLQLQTRGYHRFGSGNPVAYGIDRYEEVLTTLRTDPVLSKLVRVATPSLQFGAIAGNFAAGVSRTVIVTGSVAGDMALMREWNDYGLRGSLPPVLLASTPDNAALIGTGVARVLHLCAPLKVADCEGGEAGQRPAAGPLAAQASLPDDIASLASATSSSATPSSGSPRIEILAASATGAPNVGSVEVVRAQFQGVKELDDIYVALHLPQAQRLVFGQGAPKATAIALQLHRTAQIPQARARLDELMLTRLKDHALEIFDYEDLNPFYGQTLAMFASIFGFIALLIGSVVLFTIGNTVSMTVVERTVEIGTLRAIGVRRRGIVASFLLEAVALGAVGAIVGIVCALAIAAAINRAGLTWLPPGWIEPVPLTVRVAGESAMMFGSAATLVVVAALSSLMPALRASRLNIVDALRHV
jgi:putative ABC transport system permease protein